MKLPNAHRAVVDLTKLRDYCLSPTHPRGRHKARVFAAALGLTAADATILRTLLLNVAKEGEAVPTEGDEYGQRYTLDFPLTEFPAPGLARQAVIRSYWIVRRGEDFPRLTSCFVL